MGFFILLRALLTVTIVVGLSALMKKSRSRDTSRLTGEVFEVKGKKIVTSVCVITAIFCGIMVAVSMYVIGDLYLSLLFLLLLILLLALAVGSKQWRVLYNSEDDFFEYTTWFGNTKKIVYRDIDTLKFVYGRIMIKDGKMTFWISNFSTGYNDFAELIMHKTPVTV